MAKLNIVSPMFLVTLLMGVAMVLPGLANQAPAPATEDFKSLEECAVKFGACGYEVYLFVFEHGRPVSDKCCAKLVQVGKVCHEKLVKYLLSKPGYTGNVSEKLAMGEKVWDYCAFLAPAYSPSI